MARCKDCVHFGICKKGFPFADGKGGGWCEDFKSKFDCVPVVRCKDCKHRVKSRWHESYQCGNECDGMASGVELKDDDFCSYGERRE